MAEHYDQTESHQSLGPWHSNFFGANFKHPESAEALLRLALTPSQLALFDLDSLTVESNTLVSALALKAGYSVC